MPAWARGDERQLSVVRRATRQLTSTSDLTNSRSKLISNSFNLDGVLVRPDRKRVAAKKSSGSAMSSLFPLVFGDITEFDELEERDSSVE